MQQSSARLAVFAVLMTAMVAVLLGRTVQLQVGTGAEAAAAAQDNRVRVLVDEPVRGAIVDQAGRPMAANRQVLRVVADLEALYALPEDGADIVTAVADLLGTDFGAVDAQLTPCDSPRAAPGQCWDGSPSAPIPIAADIDLTTVLPIIEQPARFPGFGVDTITVRSYPGRAGERAGHLLGRLGAVSEEELAQGPYRPDDVVGRGGLEERYEVDLRGTPSRRTVEVDTAGREVRTLAHEPGTDGSTLVTSIDAALQAVVEDQLAAAVERARATEEADLAADSAAAVVLDVTNGRVLAMASYPDYSPSVFDGGISAQQYQSLADSGALLFTPLQGTYAPGSTFKPFTVAAMAEAGFALDAEYPCPSSYAAGGRNFANFESKGYGTISLQRALEVSCNTVFYSAADQIWRSAGGEGAGPDAADPVFGVAEDFGLGQPTGIDLPGEATGLVSGRLTKRSQWEQLRERWCSAAEEGYPELRVTDPQLAEEYTELDREHCQSGGLWRQGDAINASIGQGLTSITPLQLAVAYAAIANGGTRYRPQVAKALVGQDGAVTEFAPEVLGQVAVDPSTLGFLTTAMRGVTSRGSAAAAFAGFPLDRVPVAGKTGSAQVPGGRPSTSWFASFAPADRPRYAVIMMVTQGGTGGGTSAPSVRAIYEAIFGVEGSSIDPQRSVLTGGAPMSEVPQPGASASVPAAQLGQGEASGVVEQPDAEGDR